MVTLMRWPGWEHETKKHFREELSKQRGQQVQRPWYWGFDGIQWLLNMHWTHQTHQESLNKESSSQLCRLGAWFGKPDWGPNNEDSAVQRGEITEWNHGKTRPRDPLPTLPAGAPSFPLAHIHLPSAAHLSSSPQPNRPIEMFSSNKSCCYNCPYEYDHLLNIDFIPGIVLSTLHTWTHCILTTTLWDRCV